MIQLARPADNMQAGPLQQRKRYGGPPQDMQFQPGAMSQFGDMFKDQMLKEGMKKMAIKKGMTAAGTAMGGPIGGFAAGVGADLLPALLGSYFNEGGMAGMLGPLSMERINKVKYKRTGGKASEEIEIGLGPLSQGE
tara:strand:- start:1 stop:411 length:411 start_codon:yes stop_codon:yes gene_type:complete